MTENPIIDEDCEACYYPDDPEIRDDKCPNSERPCGHHCNHSWSHDECCWCGKEWEGE
jgi:hypothetical protein